MSATKTGLSGTQKAAIVLMNMDQDGAANVMKQFSDIEAEEIAAEIVRLRRVDSIVAERALTEFHELAVSGQLQPRGGRDFATGLLEASFGTERAAGVMKRVTSSMAGRAFEFLDDAEPPQIVAMLDGEMPATVALVLAHLRPEHASAALAGFPDSMRAEVAHAIATMGSAAPEAVAIVAETLKLSRGVAAQSRETVEVIGGIGPLIEILNRSDVATERALLDGLQQRDPALAEEVRSMMLTFADIVRLDDREVQQVLRGLDSPTLAIAMKGSSEQVVETVRRNLSDRNRELLEDELLTMPPVRMSQVEDARAAAVRIIRDLEALGQLTVQRSEEDAYVE